MWAELLKTVPQKGLLEIGMYAYRARQTPVLRKHAEGYLKVYAGNGEMAQGYEGVVALPQGRVWLPAPT